MKAIAILCLILAPVSSLADQTAIANFSAGKTRFWNDLYPTGGNTLYCDQQFAGHSGLDVEHVYPASWMGAHLGCGNRKACGRRPNTAPTHTTARSAHIHTW